MKRIFITIVIAAYLISPEIHGQDPGSAPVESITEAEMRDHIFFLASDYLKGRVATSPEYEIAAQYVAAQYASAGIEPVNSEEGDISGYFQHVPFEKMTFGEEASWVLTSESESQEFLHNKDYKILEGRFMPEGPMDVVFAGYGIHEPDHGWDDFDGINIEGNMVLVMAGAPEKKGKAILPDSLHKAYSSMMGLQQKVLPLFERKPSAVVLVLDKQTSAMIPFDRMPSNLSDEMYRYMGSDEGEEGFRIPMIYLVKDEVIRSLFEGQKYDPANIEEDGIKKYRTYQLEDITVETKFSVLERSEVSSNNVVGIVKGTDPDLRDQFITVGAHLDHVNYGGEVINGADDDASGTAGVMEIAEAVAMNPPRRSVVFIAYTAEEMGLHGSHFFVNAGPLPQEEIKFNVNLDMIGRTTEENMETRSHYVLGNSKFEKKLKPFIAEINDETVQYPLIFDFHHRYSGSSDHASYHDVGIPAFFFFSGDHKDLHQPGDDADKIEYDKAVKISRLAYEITMKLANMDEVPDFLE